MRRLLCVFISLILLFEVGYCDEFDEIRRLRKEKEERELEEYQEEREVLPYPSLETIKTMEYATHSNLTMEQLEKGLLYDLKPLAEAYIYAENTYNVNAVLKAAQDALESDWGRNCFKKNNISGFFTNSEFWSKEECIYFTSERLEKWYIQPPHEECNHRNCEIGQFFEGRTIYDVTIHYCPVEDGGINYEYGDMVCAIALDIYKRIYEE